MYNLRSQILTHTQYGKVGSTPLGLLYYTPLCSKRFSGVGVQNNHYLRCATAIIFIWVDLLCMPNNFFSQESHSPNFHFCFHTVAPPKICSVKKCKGIFFKFIYVPLHAIYKMLTMQVSNLATRIWDTTAENMLQWKQKIKEIWNYK